MVLAQRELIKTLARPCFQAETEARKAVGRAVRLPCALGSLHAFSKMGAGVPPLFQCSSLLRDMASRTLRSSDTLSSRPLTHAGAPAASAPCAARLAAAPDLNGKEIGF